MEKIEALRKKIDEIDEQILNSLKERVAVCRAIGAIKREHGIPIRDHFRENELYERLNEKTIESGLSGPQVEAIYRGIIALCVHAQEFDAKTPLTSTKNQKR